MLKKAKSQFRGILLLAFVLCLANGCQSLQNLRSKQKSPSKASCCSCTVPCQNVNCSCGSCCTPCSAPAKSNKNKSVPACCCNSCCWNGSCNCGYSSGCCSCCCVYCKCSEPSCCCCCTPAKSKKGKANRQNYCNSCSCCSTSYVKPERYSYSSTNSMIDYERELNNQLNDTFTLVVE